MGRVLECFSAAEPLSKGAALNYKARAVTMARPGPGTAIHTEQASTKQRAVNQ